MESALYMDAPFAKAWRKNGFHAQLIKNSCLVSRVIEIVQSVNGNALTAQEEKMGANSYQCVAGCFRNC